MQVILDEANHATLSEAMIVLGKGVQQLAIVGDPQQLGPFTAIDEVRIPFSQ